MSLNGRSWPKGLEGVAQSTKVFALSENMERAIDALIDALVGDDPSPLEFGPGAEKRREARRDARTVILQLVFLARREGREQLLLEQKRIAEATKDAR
jgi:hypothetical protein